MCCNLVGMAPHCPSTSEPILVDRSLITSGLNERAQFTRRQKHGPDASYARIERVCNSDSHSKIRARRREDCKQRNPAMRLRSRASAHRQLYSIEQVCLDELYNILQLIHQCSAATPYNLCRPNPRVNVYAASYIPPAVESMVENSPIIVGVPGVGLRQ